MTNGDEREDGFSERKIQPIGSFTPQNSHAHHACHTHFDPCADLPPAHTLFLTSLQPCRRIRYSGTSCHKRHQSHNHACPLSPLVPCPPLNLHCSGTIGWVESTRPVRTELKNRSYIKRADDDHRPIIIPIDTTSPGNVERLSKGTGDSLFSI